MDPKLQAIIKSRLPLGKTNEPTVDSFLSRAQSGTYSLTFNFSDIAQNYLDGVIVNLTITA